VDLKCLKVFKLSFNHGSRNSPTRGLCSDRQYNTCLFNGAGGGGGGGVEFESLKQYFRHFEDILTVCITALKTRSLQNIVSSLTKR
jgi:hypothetical protein